jgi:hydroxyacylglutathione hydrolase
MKPMLEIVTFTLGPAVTNAYLVAETETGQAVVIDPAWDGHIILAESKKRSWQIGGLWYTHAHFDHIGGAAEIAAGLDPQPTVALHPADLPLWQVKGGAILFGFNLDPGPEPSLELFHGQILHLGSSEFEVRHAPGHTPGLVVFYCAPENVCFCGDLIFQGSVGRTDLPGGDWETLEESIREQIYTLPDGTRLLSGHGPETTVGWEKRSNPFVPA